MEAGISRSVEQFTSKRARHFPAESIATPPTLTYRLVYRTPAILTTTSLSDMPLYDSTCIQVQTFALASALAGEAPRSWGAALPHCVAATPTHYYRRLA